MRGPGPKRREKRRRVAAGGALEISKYAVATLVLEPHEGALEMLVNGVSDRSRPSLTLAGLLNDCTFLLETLRPPCRPLHGRVSCSLVCAETAHERLKSR
jgi:hypothetical protein